MPLQLHQCCLACSPPIMQVFRHGAGGYWRASKRWCKTLPVELVDKALLSFAHNGERTFCPFWEHPVLSCCWVGAVRLPVELVDKALLSFAHNGGCCFFPAQWAVLCMLLRRCWPSCF